MSEPYDPYVSRPGEVAPAGHSQPGPGKTVRSEPYDPYVSRPGEVAPAEHSQPGPGKTVRSEPYDPYVPRAGEVEQTRGVGFSRPGPSKTAAIQAQIDDTVDLMKDNIQKVAERGERLDSLQDKTENLAVSAQGFRRGANRVRKNMWWKDMKMRIIIGTAITVILIIIIVSVVRATKH